MNATACYFVNRMESETSAIARGLRRRDPDLLDRLIEQYQHRLLRYLVSLTADRAIAEDLFQETWMRVLERGHQYDGRHEFSTWLYTIARNLAIDQPAPEAASSQLGRTHGGGRLGPALRACQRWAICPGYGGAARGGRTRRGGNERPAHRVPRDRGPSLPGGAWAAGDRDPYQAPVGHGEVAPVPCLEYADR